MWSLEHLLERRQMIYTHHVTGFTKLLRERKKVIGRVPRSKPTYHSFWFSILPNNIICHTAILCPPTVVSRLNRHDSESSAIASNNNWISSIELRTRIALKVILSDYIGKICSSYLTNLKERVRAEAEATAAIYATDLTAHYLKGNELHVIISIAIQWPLCMNNHCIGRQILFDISI